MNNIIPQTNYNRICGIYKITNTITGDFYIGSSNNIRKRIYAHRWELTSNKHGNSYLQNAWNKYGEQAFVFSVVLLCDIEHKLYFEQGFLDLFKPVYNLATCAAHSGQGLPVSKETRRKLSEAHKGEKSYLFGTHLSEETKQKLSEANKGERNYLFGKHLSEETKRKISEATIGRVCSEELRKKRSENAKGERNPNFGKHSPSEEGRAKMSEANKGNTYALGRKRTEETKRKISKIVTRWWAEKKKEIPITIS